jgi:hypothetical protein
MINEIENQAEEKKLGEKLGNKQIMAFTPVLILLFLLDKFLAALSLSFSQLFPSFSPK